MKPLTEIKKPNRSVVLSVRVTPAEKEAIAKVAALDNRTIVDEIVTLAVSRLWDIESTR